MKIPTPRKQPSGNFFIRLRLDGESIPITAPTAAECVKRATLIKAEHKMGIKKTAKHESLTVWECFDLYLDSRKNSLSPLTIRGYRIVQNNHFAHLMQRPAAELTKADWQKTVDNELASYSVKTMRNAYAAAKTVVYDATGIMPPKLSFPVAPAKEYAFLQPGEIPIFIKAVKDTKYAVPLLLALNSLRISEISHLQWSDLTADSVIVHGAEVLNENNKWVRKDANKNETSSRVVPLLIPELRDAIKRDRQKSGYVMPCTQNNLRVALHKICNEAGITDVSCHGLRHSFASLCYHLQVPTKIAQEIGGWKDDRTMQKIYTHIAKTDMDRYKGILFDFFKNGNENVNA